LQAYVDFYAAVAEVKGVRVATFFDWIRAMSAAFS
jgi:hypothetical protein